MQDEEAFSGIEAAIILIAFVVVAAVFSYAVIGAGFFASQKSQETVQEGTKTAQASVYQEGGIFGTLDPNTGQLDTLSFTLYVAEAGVDQDLTEMTISYTQSDISNPKEYTWSGTAANSDHFFSGGSEMLYEGHNQRIDLDEVQGPMGGGWFAIEIRPKRGSSLFMKRWLATGYNGGVII